MSARKAVVCYAEVKGFFEALGLLVPAPKARAFYENPARFIESYGVHLTNRTSGLTPDTGDYVIWRGVFCEAHKNLAAALNALDGDFGPHTLPSYGISIEDSKPFWPESWASSSEALRASDGERQLPGASVSSCPDITPRMISAGVEALFSSYPEDEGFARVAIRVYTAMEKAKTSAGNSGGGPS